MENNFNVHSIEITVPASFVVKSLKKWLVYKVLLLSITHSDEILLLMCSKITKYFLYQFHSSSSGLPVLLLENQDHFVPSMQ